MEKYVKYLLSDIAAAEADAAALAYHRADEDADEYDFVSAEEEEQNAPYEMLARRIGVKKEWFPPADRLNEDMQQRILDVLGRCLSAYGFILHFPDGLPVPSKYQILIDYLNKEVPVLAYHQWQIDFCDYEPNACPFGEGFCQCKSYEQWLHQLESEDSSLSFEGLDELINPHLNLLGFFLNETGKPINQSDSFEGGEEAFQDEEYDLEDEEGWENDEGYGFLFFDSRDYEPGPDDDCWN